MRFRVVVLIVLAIAGSVLLASAPKSTITISVTNQYDKPVDNADVILDFLGSRDLAKLGFRKAVHWELHTNQQGIAHFPPVPYGTVQVQVITKRYQTFGNKFDVNEEQKKIDVKLNPPQKQYSAHPPLKPADQPKQ